MVPVDPWSFLVAGLFCITNGFSPFAFPLVLVIAFQYFPTAWWLAVFSRFSVFQVTSILIPVFAIVTYWVNGFFLLAVDRFVRPEKVREFKLQPGKKFNQQLLPKICINILKGQIFVIIPYAMVCAYLGVVTPLKLSHEAELPTPRRMLFELLAMIFFNEFTFFYGHWALHQKVCGVNLYARFHKIHHEFTAPIGLAASYCHPVEMLVSNCLPLTFGASLVQAHTFTLLIWVMFAVMSTQFHHGGYHWPWVPSFDHHPDFHDLHHEHFSSNFGNMGILDKLHGTDKSWEDALKKGDRQPKHYLGTNMILGGLICGGVYAVGAQLESR